MSPNQHSPLLCADFGKRQLAMREDIEQTTLYAEELSQLQKLLHFPEEVAMMLTKTEYDLFNKVLSCICQGCTK